MKGRPKRERPKYDADGMPINPNDWEYEDWQILWMGYKAIRAGIAARHRERAEKERAWTNESATASVSSAAKT